jgi:hypothetical protein
LASGNPKLTRKTIAATIPIPMSSGTPWYTHRDSVSFAGDFTVPIIGEHWQEAEMTDVIRDYTQNPYSGHFERLTGQSMENNQ